MGYYIAAFFLLNTMMSADQWGGPHWLVILGQGLSFMAFPTAAIALIYYACHEARTTPTHSQPSHDDQQKKNK